MTTADDPWTGLEPPASADIINAKRVDGKHPWNFFWARSMAVSLSGRLMGAGNRLIRSPAAGNSAEHTVSDISPPQSVHVEQE